MKLVISKFGFGVLVFILIQLGSCVHSKRSDEAYVTLLYGDEFLLGVRVLGKSIRETGSTKDMVVLVSEGVSDYAMKLLRADGWIVEIISLLANPNQKRPKRFWGVYTKLKIFNMTNYKKVVYLDADTIVVKSIEDLFKCGKFCANLKHSERMNSGVMVVEPSEAVFKDMMSKVNTLPSYTGGDQGFLNSYFAGFANAHIFEPNSEINSQSVAEMERLSTLYNADVGLYVLANKWMVDEKELRVIHYTLGPLKPWDWWTSWLLKPVDVWQDMRVRLDETLPGTGGGGNPGQQFLVKILFLLPFCVLLFFYYHSFFQIRHDFLGSLCRNSLCDCIKRIYYKCRSGGLSYSSVMVPSSLASSTQQFSSGTIMKLGCLGAFSVLVCFTFVTISIAIAFLVVPRQVMPWTGLLLLYEWTFTLFGILFESYLHLIQQWGRGTLSQTATVISRSESADYDSMKGHQHQASVCDIMALFCWFGMAFFSIVAPLLPCALGITAMFARLCMLVAGGLMLASFMTYASGYLAIRAFIKGLDDFDSLHSRSSCFI